MRNIKYEALIRLRATSAALNEGTWLYKMPGGMNEQALSNLAFAFNKTGELGSADTAIVTFLNLHRLWLGFCSIMCACTSPVSLDCLLLAEVDLCVCSW